MKKMIFIVGPTSSGKSELALKLAKDLKFEIISIDAFQIYKELNIGVNKPKDDILNEIKHHFINQISINESWDIKKFHNCFFQTIKENSSKNFIGIGGSNLYISSVIENYNFPEIAKNNFSQYTTDDLYDQLKKLDLDESKKINKNNRKRIEQALNFISSTNQQRSKLKNNEKLINPFIIKTNLPRQDLYQKINKKVDEMMSSGWVDEVKDFMKKYDKNLNAFCAIGYKQIWNDLENKLPVNINKIKQQTRQYAKKQETWCKNKFNINFEYKNLKDYNNLLNECKKFFN